MLRETGAGASAGSGIVQACAICLAPLDGACIRCAARACPVCDECQGCGNIVCQGCDGPGTPSFEFPGDRYRHPHFVDVWERAG